MPTHPPAGPIALEPPDVSAAMWYVYILRCGDATFYTGIAKDVRRRILAHEKGAAARYTRGRQPVTLVYQEVQQSRGLALRREAAIKKLSRKQKELLIESSS